MNAYAMQSEPHAHVVLSLIHCNYIKTSDQDLEETLPQNTDRYIYIPPIHLDHTSYRDRSQTLSSLFNSAAENLRGQTQEQPTRQYYIKQLPIPT